MDAGNSIADRRGILRPILAGRAAWGRALIHGVPVAAAVLALFVTWFGIADRYRVFLYDHLGATPFDAVTGSRYWMAGLVAAGAVMVCYTLANWLAGRVAVLRGRAWAPPPWQQVWLVAVPPLLVGIPLVTMTLNHPVLPWTWALRATLAAVTGLAFALMPGRWAARRPWDLAWLVLSGLGLVPVLFILRALELPARGIISPALGLLVGLGSIPIGGLWLAGVAWLAARCHRPVAHMGSLLAAGLCLSYLGLPLVHHLLATPPGYRYITTASNFFALNPALQAGVLVVAAAGAAAATRLQRAFAGRVPHP
jgi:hypothetical protein